MNRYFIGSEPLYTLPLDVARHSMRKQAYEKEKVSADSGMRKAREQTGRAR